MPRGSTIFGDLNYLAQTDGTNCSIVTPCGVICLKILPDITDSKSANYTNEVATGRSSPIVNYGYSEARMISTELHFMVTTSQDINDNWFALKTIQSLVYPQPPSANLTAPYIPPPVVRFICGQLMDGTNGLCLVLKSYSVRYPTEVAWDVDTFLPYKFSISCQWEVVYACSNLPSNTCSSNTNPPTSITGVTYPTSTGVSSGGGGGGGTGLMASNKMVVRFAKRGGWDG